MKAAAALGYGDALDLLGQLSQAAALLRSAGDLLPARPQGEAPPPALTERGWAGWLAALSEEALARFEVEGPAAPWPTDAPPSLVRLAAQISEATALPALSTTPRPAPAARGASARTSAQIDAFAARLLPLAQSAQRVLDVGSGHGHLTRTIAERIALPVVGLERDRALVRRAAELAPAAGPSFALRDVLTEGLLARAGDCLIGLHACGELGDAMVQAAASSGAASLALVGCCLQKRRAPTRPALVQGPELPREVLGLSNLSAREQGVEASRAENLAGRQRRLALHRLLSNRIGPLRPGSEIAGLNRRAAQGSFAALAKASFALRGLAAPTAAEVAEAERWAAEVHPLHRRWALPRNFLARVLEVYVLLDRAAYLRERGFVVEVGSLFPPEISPRNLALLAAAPSAAAP